MSISAAELYAIHFENEEPSSFTMIPNILSYLTYTDPDTGEIKKLSVYARELYRIIRMHAGNKGLCWANRDNLAEECGMSAGSVTNAKRILQMPFHQLDGNPLIRIEKKSKYTHKNEERVNKTEYDCITILNIWKWNNAYMATKKFLAEQKNEGVRSPDDRAEGVRSPDDRPPQGAKTPHDTNNITNNNTPLFKEQDRASPFVCSSEKKKICLSGKEKIVEALIKEGSPPEVAERIASNHSTEDIINAFNYAHSQRKKPGAKPIRNGKIAYLQDILNKRYWEKSNK